MKGRPVRAAVIDLNNNVPNEGMRCIREMLDDKYSYFPVIGSTDYQVFDARHKGEIPDSHFDIYISSGGPGSPFEDEGKPWETAYFQLIDKIWNHNQNPNNTPKFFFFICHSFQMMCRFFDFVEISKRHSTSFGITHVDKTEIGKQDFLFDGLPNSFYVADFRDFQALHPNEKKFKELGASILTIEKDRPHLSFERAVTAIRLSDTMVGTQFHPEADAYGMNIHFHKPEKKKLVLEHHGEDKYHELIRGLSDKNKIDLTHRKVLPNFLRHAVNTLREYEPVISTS